jgi:hypothetical protein
MGILTKIASAYISKRLESQIPPLENPSAKTDDSETPSARCPNCQAAGRPPQYGWHFWRDAYGSWNCTECRPPATLAQVRRERLVKIQKPTDAGNSLLNPAIIECGQEFPELVRGYWRQVPDGEGRWVLERVGPDGEFVTSERRRWWATAGWEGLPVV